MNNGSELALILEGGKTAHENHSADLRKQIERIGLLEMSAIAAPAFAAAIGSACAVVFYTANHSLITAGIEDLAIILAWFFAAVLLSVMVPGFSWLRQYTHTLGLAEQKLDYEAPYVHENARSRLLTQSSQLCRIAAIAAIAASYGALVVGGFAFIEIMR
ncbi:MAG: hypothetical protein GY789_20000 [Hyphomicrobiales bacterium]|nr:hypothetical protein [Hyphomicrobiales bacterium]MCP4999757.1 hypothetical protein [Hyphomicrobiales bacterium]